MSDTHEKIECNIEYSGTWWSNTVALRQFFSYTEKFHAKMTIKLLKTFGLTPSRLLDIGSSSGYFAKSFSNRFHQIHHTQIGLDISPDNVLRLNKEFKDIDNAFFLMMSPYDSSLPFKNQSIDTIVCNHVIEHVPDDLKLLDEIHRILTADGTFVVAFPINEEKLDVSTHLRKYDIALFKKIITGKFTIESYGENDTFSHFIRVLSVRKTLVSNALKKCLILILSFIPFGITLKLDVLFRNRNSKSSQIYAILKKAT